MAVEFVGGKVWDTIARACSGRGKRRAAIAYVGADAPGRLRLRHNDLLVVNAGRDALLSHATSPEALGTYLEAGVRVLSCPTLHAKVVATPRVAVVGSANASRSSTGLDEAIVVVDGKRAVSEAHDFVDSLLERSDEVTPDFVEAARTIWAEGWPSRRPGAGSDQTSGGLLPAPPFRLFILGTHIHGASGAEQQLLIDERRRQASTSGPAGGYRIESIRLSPDRDRYRPGDVLIEWDEFEGELCVWPPTLVFSGPASIPRTKDVLHFVRRPTQLEPIPLQEAKVALERDGLRPRLTEDREVRSPKVREALLGLWYLSGDPESGS